MSTSTTPDKKMAKMLKQAHDSVMTEWGHAFNKLGSRVQRALLAEAVLSLAAMQDDEEVSDAAVRRIVVDGWSWAAEEAGY